METTLRERLSWAEWDKHGNVSLHWKEIEKLITEAQEEMKRKCLEAVDEIGRRKGYNAIRDETRKAIEAITL